MDKTIMSLSDIGSWASIIGIFITIITFWMVFGIRRKFLFRSQVDDHGKRLIEIASEMSALLQSYGTNKEKIEELFALANVELRAMQNGAEGHLLTDIKTSRSLIRKYSSKLWFNGDPTESSARKIKTSITVISAQLYHEKKNFTIGR